MKKVVCKPLRWTMLRPDAQYVSRGRKEFVIKQDSLGFWFVQGYKGGAMPPELRQVFTSFRACEDQLIKYLKRTDKFGKAIYPGCPERSRINFIEHLSKVS